MVGATRTPTGPTVAYQQQPPGTHDGNNAFTFRFGFSEDLHSKFSYKTMRDHSLIITQGGVRLTPYVKRAKKGSNQNWIVTVTPGGNGVISIALASATSCSDTGALCTEAGTLLSNTLPATTVLGPAGSSVVDAIVQPPEDGYETLISVRQEYKVSDNYLMRAPYSARVVSTNDAYLTTGGTGNHVLRIRTGTPFSGTYPLANEVSGWNSPNNEITWPTLLLQNLESDIGSNHNIALAYTNSYASDGNLDYAAYGWWAVAPESHDWFRPRILAAFGGLSLGIDTASDDMPGSVDAPMTATWRGRATGQALGKARRWALSGDVELTATLRGASGGQVQGEISNTRIVQVGAHTVKVDGRTAGDWHTITLSPAQVQGNTYSGIAGIKDPIVKDPDTGQYVIPPGFVGPLMRAPLSGSYEGAFYGPGAAETSGRGYVLFDNGTVRHADTSVVFGFGAKR